jgi:hypothetical protein
MPATALSPPAAAAQRFSSTTARWRRPATPPTAITVRNATTAALGNLITGATGTTTLGVGADISGAVTQTAATAINTGTLTASTGGAITLDKANTITNLGAVTRGGAFTLNDTGPAG